MTDRLLARARAGDERAFRGLTDPYRRELQLHVYRIVGSAQDAEDLVQETLLAGMARPRTVSGARVGTFVAVPDRHQPIARRLAGSPAPPRRPADDADARADPVQRALWLSPYPDVLLEGVPDEAPGPDARYEAKETVGLRSSSASSISRPSSGLC